MQMAVNLKISEQGIEWTFGYYNPITVQFSFHITVLILLNYNPF